jgi:hypothetical protein
MTDRRAEYRYVWEETTQRGNVTVTVLSKTPLKNPPPVTPNPRAAEAIALFGSQKGENR